MISKKRPQMYELFRFVTYGLQFVVLIITIDPVITSQNSARIFITYLIRAGMLQA